MEREWARSIYRPGDAERAYAQSRFWKGDLHEEELARAEQLATSARVLHQTRRQLGHS